MSQDTSEHTWKTVKMKHSAIVTDTCAHTCTSTAFCTELGKDLEYGASARTKHNLKPDSENKDCTVPFHEVVITAPRMASLGTMWM
jgi:hypothetical protein